jgi:hypothetical protein
MATPVCKLQNISVSRKVWEDIQNTQQKITEGNKFKTSWKKKQQYPQLLYFNKTLDVRCLMMQSIAEITQGGWRMNE